MNNNQSNLLITPNQFVPPLKGEKIFCEGNCYYLGDQIGQGGFGIVYECMDDWENKLVAKVLMPKNRMHDQVRDEWLAEFRNLTTLRHPCITYVHQAFEYRNTFYLIVERCSYDLNYFIGQSTADGNSWLPYIARDILHGLDFIHKRGYVHKDMHPGNVFVSHHYDFMVPSKDPVWSFKIGDLGISRLEGNIQLFNTILAQWMVPPEYLNPAEFGMLGKQIDIYHTGLLLLGILLKRIPVFSREDILNGMPRRTAEGLNSPYASVLAKALRRHVAHRTQTAIDMWREISALMPRLNY